MIFPEGVHTICTGAFEFCRALREVSLPESLVTICFRAFESCPISSLTIPANEDPGLKAAAKTAVLEYSHQNLKPVDPERALRL